MGTQKKVGRGFMTLKIELLSTGIMRTIVVPEYMTLVDLSNAIQAVMGWEHEHLWDFHARGRDGVYYEIPSREEYPSFASRLTLDATQVKLKKAFPARGTKLVYEYDFGDGWEHLVTRMADPKIPEIACVKSVGPDGIEDFGGPWRLAEVLEGMRTRTPKGTSEDLDYWIGFSNGQDVQTYLKGETAEVKTQKLLEAIGCVTVDPPEEEPEVASSDEDKAHLLGSLFATTINMDVWEILEDALKNGGTCEFDDADCSLSEFFLTFFDGLKVKAGRSTPFFTNPSKLTVPKEWVTWYGQYAKDWHLQRGPFDILESYANSAVHLYGVMSTDDFYNLVLRYDPGLQLPKDEVVRQLEARLLCPIGSYSIEDDLLVDARIASSERGDPDKMIRGLRKSHREFPRWYPATRDELFKWDVLRSPARTVEVERLEFVLRTLCKCPEGELEGVVDTIFGLMSAGAPPDAIYEAMVASGLCERMSTNVRQPLLAALDDWAAIIRVPCLNGHSAREIFAEQAARVSSPKIGRNAPCPCGSGKKYKLCCGKMA